MNSGKIVSLIASATEMLYGMGLEERVVGVSHECDWPHEVQAKPRLTRSRIDDMQPSAVIDQEVRESLAEGAALYAIDEAALCSLAPEVIVTQAQCDVCAVSHDEVLGLVAARPELADTQVVALNPQSLADIFAGILRLGETVGARDAARRYTSVLRRRVESIRNASVKVRRAARPRVACIEWIEPLMLAGNWVPELVELAGGGCELTVAGSHSRYHEWGELRDFDPEVIVVAACGFELERTVREAVRLKELPGWSELAAVRSGRVWAVDGNAYFNRSGPRIVDSLELLAHLVQPERFSMPPGCESGVAALQYAA